MFKCTVLSVYNFVLVKSEVKYQPSPFNMDSVVMDDTSAKVKMEDLIKKKKVLGCQ